MALRQLYELVFMDFCTLVLLLFVAVAPASSATVRLVNGSSPWEGRVEMLINKNWLTVCDNQWDDNDAIVVCRTLGFNTIGASAFSGASFGRGTGSILRNDIYCRGTEEHFMNCNFVYRLLDFCSHAMDSGVRCGPTVRLVGGSSPKEGRVEVKMDGEWGTVCDDGWNDADAKVVCRNLGFDSERATGYSGAYFGPGSGPFSMNEVECDGTEKHLLDCPFLSRFSCNHSKDAGVRCEDTVSESSSWCIFHDSGTVCSAILGVCLVLPALIALRIVACFWRPNNRRGGACFIKEYRPVSQNESSHNSPETKFDSVSLWCACVWHYILCCFCNFHSHLQRRRTGSEFTSMRERENTREAWANVNGSAAMPPAATNANANVENAENELEEIILTQPGERCDLNAKFQTHA